MSKNLINLILKNAQTLTQMHKDLHQKAEDQAHNPQALQDATKLFNDSYNQLAFPGGLDTELTLLKNGDPKAIAAAIEYLDANPYFFRSGYVKGEIARRLKQVTLTPQQTKDLQNILIRTIGTSGREAREYGRLACKIADPAFYERLQEFIKQAGDARLAKKAQRILDALPKTQPIT